MLTDTKFVHIVTICHHFVCVSDILLLISAADEGISVRYMDLLLLFGGVLGLTDVGFLLGRLLEELGRRSTVLFVFRCG